MNVKHFIKMNSGTILGCVAVIGSVASIAMAIRDTHKMEPKIEKFKKMDKKDKVITVAKNYAPTIATSVATVACIAGSTILNKKSQASLASAYALTHTCYNQYRNKVIERYGKEVDNEINEEVEIEAEIYKQDFEFHQIHLDTPDHKFLFYDDYSGHTFHRYEREVIDAEYHLNRNFILNGGIAKLNDFYKLLDIPKVAEGDGIGWCASEGYDFIDFAHIKMDEDGGGEPIYKIEYRFCPCEEAISGFVD